MKIFSVSYKTLYNWFDRWELEGMVGLYNKPGRGSKPIFTVSQQAQIKAWVQQEPSQLKKVSQKLKQNGTLLPVKKRFKESSKGQYELASDA